MKSEFWKQCVIAALPSLINTPRSLDELRKEPLELFKDRLGGVCALADYLDAKSKEGKDA